MSRSCGDRLPEPESDSYGLPCFEGNSGGIADFHTQLARQADHASISLADKGNGFESSYNFPAIEFINSEGQVADDKQQPKLESQLEDKVGDAPIADPGSELGKALQRIDQNNTSRYRDVTREEIETVDGKTKYLWRMDYQDDSKIALFAVLNPGLKYDENLLFDALTTGIPEIICDRDIFDTSSPSRDKGKFSHYVRTYLTAEGAQERGEVLRRLEKDCLDGAFDDDAYAFQLLKTLSAAEATLKLHNASNVGEQREAIEDLATLEESGGLDRSFLDNVENGFIPRHFIKSTEVRDAFLEVNPGGVGQSLVARARQNARLEIEGRAVDRDRAVIARGKALAASVRQQSGDKANNATEKSGAPDKSLSGTTDGARGERGSGSSSPDGVASGILLQDTRRSENRFADRAARVIASRTQGDIEISVTRGQKTALRTTEAVCRILLTDKPETAAQALLDLAVLARDSKSKSAQNIVACLKEHNLTPEKLYCDLRSSNSRVRLETHEQLKAALSPERKKIAALEKADPADVLIALTDGTSDDAGKTASAERLETLEKNENRNRDEADKVIETMLDRKSTPEEKAQALKRLEELSEIRRRSLRSNALAEPLALFRTSSILRDLRLKLDAASKDPTGASEAVKSFKALLDNAGRCPQTAGILSSCLSGMTVQERATVIRNLDDPTKQGAEIKRLAAKLRINETEDLIDEWRLGRIIRNLDDRSTAEQFSESVEQLKLERLAGNKGAEEKLAWIESLKELSNFSKSDATQAQRIAAVDALGQRALQGDPFAARALSSVLLARANSDSKCDWHEQALFLVKKLPVFLPQGDSLNSDSYQQLQLIAMKHLEAAIIAKKVVAGKPEITALSYVLTNESRPNQGSPEVGYRARTLLTKVLSGDGGGRGRPETMRHLTRIMLSDADGRTALVPVFTKCADADSINASVDRFGEKAIFADLTSIRALSAVASGFVGSDDAERRSAFWLERAAQSDGLRPTLIDELVASNWVNRDRGLLASTLGTIAAMDAADETKRGAEILGRASGEPTLNAALEISWRMLLRPSISGRITEIVQSGIKSSDKKQHASAVAALEKLAPYLTVRDLDAIKLNPTAEVVKCLGKVKDQLPADVRTELMSWARLQSARNDEQSASIVCSAVKISGLFARYANDRDVIALAKFGDLPRSDNVKDNRVFFPEGKFGLKQRGFSDEDSEKILKNATLSMMQIMAKADNPEVRKKAFEAFAKLDWTSLDEEMHDQLGVAFREFLTREELSPEIRQKINKILGDGFALSLPAILHRLAPGRSNERYEQDASTIADTCQRWGGQRFIEGVLDRAALFNSLPEDVRFKLTKRRQQVGGAELVKALSSGYFMDDLPFLAPTKDCNCGVKGPFAPKDLRDLVDGESSARYDALRKAKGAYAFFVDRIQSRTDDLANFTKDGVSFKSQAVDAIPGVGVIWDSPVDDWKKEQGERVASIRNCQESLKATEKKVILASESVLELQLSQDCARHEKLVLLGKCKTADLLATKMLAEYGVDAVRTKAPAIFKDLTQRSTKGPVDLTQISGLERLKKKGLAQITRFPDLPSGTSPWQMENRYNAALTELNQGKLSGDNRNKLSDVDAYRTYLADALDCGAGSMSIARLGVTLQDNLEVVQKLIGPAEEGRRYGDLVDDLRSRADAMQSAIRQFDTERHLVIKQRDELREASNKCKDADMKTLLDKKVEALQKTLDNFSRDSEYRQQIEAVIKHVKSPSFDASSFGKWLRENGIELAVGIGVAVLAVTTCGAGLIAAAGLGVIGSQTTKEILYQINRGGYTGLGRYGERSYAGAYAEKSIPRLLDFVSRIEAAKDPTEVMRQMALFEATEIYEFGKDVGKPMVIEWGQGIALGYLGVGAAKIGANLSKDLFKRTVSETLKSPSARAFVQEFDRAAMVCVRTKGGQQMMNSWRTAVGREFKSNTLSTSWQEVGNQSVETALHGHVEKGGLAMQVVAVVGTNIFEGKVRAGAARFKKPDHVQIEAGATRKVIDDLKLTNRVTEVRKGVFEVEERAPQNGREPTKLTITEVPDGSMSNTVYTERLAISPRRSAAENSSSPKQEPTSTTDGASQKNEVSEWYELGVLASGEYYVKTRDGADLKLIVGQKLGIRDGKLLECVAGDPVRLEVVEGVLDAIQASGARPASVRVVARPGHESEGGSYVPELLEVTINVPTGEAAKILYFHEAGHFVEVSKKYTEMRDAKSAEFERAYRAGLEAPGSLAGRINDPEARKRVLDEAMSRDNWYVSNDVDVLRYRHCPCEIIAEHYMYFMQAKTHPNLSYQELVKRFSGPDRAKAIKHYEELYRFNEKIFAQWEADAASAKAKSPAGLKDGNFKRVTEDGRATESLPRSGAKIEYNFGKENFQAIEKSYTEMSRMVREASHLNGEAREAAMHRVLEYYSAKIEPTLQKAGVELRYGNQPEFSPIFDVKLSSDFKLGGKTPADGAVSVDLNTAGGFKEYLRRHPRGQQLFERLKSTGRDSGFGGTFEQFVGKEGRFPFQSPTSRQALTVEQKTSIAKVMMAEMEGDFSHGRAPGYELNGCQENPTTSGGTIQGKFRITVPERATRSNSDAAFARFEEVTHLFQKLNEGPLSKSGQRICEDFDSGKLKDLPVDKSFWNEYDYIGALREMGIRVPDELMAAGGYHRNLVFAKYDADRKQTEARQSKEMPTENFDKVEPSLRKPVVEEVAKSLEIFDPPKPENFGDLKPFKFKTEVMSDKVASVKKVQDATEQAEAAAREMNLSEGEFNRLLDPETQRLQSEFPDLNVNDCRTIAMARLAGGASEPRLQKAYDNLQQAKARAQVADAHLLHELTRFTEGLAGTMNDFNTAQRGQTNRLAVKYSADPNAVAGYSSKTGELILTSDILKLSPEQVGAFVAREMSSARTDFELAVQLAFTYLPPVSQKDPQKRDTEKLQDDFRARTGRELNNRTLSDAVNAARSGKNTPDSTLVPQLEASAKSTKVAEYTNLELLANKVSAAHAEVQQGKANQVLDRLAKDAAYARAVFGEPLPSEVRALVEQWGRGESVDVVTVKNVLTDTLSANMAKVNARMKALFEGLTPREKLTIAEGQAGGNNVKVVTDSRAKLQKELREDFVGNEPWKERARELLEATRIMSEREADFVLNLLRLRALKESKLDQFKKETNPDLDCYVETLDIILAGGPTMPKIAEVAVPGKARQNIELVRDLTAERKTVARDSNGAQKEAILERCIRGLIPIQPIIVMNKPELAERAVQVRDQLNAAIDGRGNEFKGLTKEQLSKMRDGLDETLSYSLGKNGKNAEQATNSLSKFMDRVNESIQTVEAVRTLSVEGRVERANALADAYACADLVPNAAFPFKALTQAALNPAVPLDLLQFISAEYKAATDGFEGLYKQPNLSGDTNNSLSVMYAMARGLPGYETWIYIPTGKQSTADHGNIDGIFLDTMTGQVRPIDFFALQKENKKEKQGKDFWAKDDKNIGDGSAMVTSTESMAAAQKYIIDFMKSTEAMATAMGPKLEPGATWRGRDHLGQPIERTNDKAFPVAGSTGFTPEFVRKVGFLPFKPGRNPDVCEVTPKDVAAELKVCQDYYNKLCDYMSEVHARDGAVPAHVANLAMGVQNLMVVLKMADIAYGAFTLRLIDPVSPTAPKAQADPDGSATVVFNSVLNTSSKTRDFQGNILVSQGQGFIPALKLHPDGRLTAVAVAKESGTLQDSMKAKIDQFSAACIETPTRANAEALARLKRDLDFIQKEIAGGKADFNKPPLDKYVPAGFEVRPDGTMTTKASNRVNPMGALPELLQVSIDRLSVSCTQSPTAANLEALVRLKSDLAFIERELAGGRKLDYSKPPLVDLLKRLGGK
ncbi:MAG: hypothetical protein K2X93_22075 [Candidatus Obscuribacterales bacterium]|nr:hypothetical protein [Candidatus Obscuribacterales bacterium]